MKLYQTPDDTLVIEHDGTLWQPTGDAHTPDLQFTSDLTEYGWEPSTGPRNGLTAVAERQGGAAEAAQDLGVGRATISRLIKDLD